MSNAMRALVTGFEPFGGDPVNPSAEAISRLPKRLGPLDIVTCRVPVSFVRAPDVLAAAIAAFRPDLVLAVGLAGGRTELSLERVAINIAESETPDNDGDQPTARPILAEGPAAWFATLPIRGAVEALRHAGLPASISNTAGTFVCNALFYRALHAAAHGPLAYRAGFLHVPYLPRQAVRHRGAASLALEHMVQAIEIILAVSAEAHATLAAP